MESRKPEPEIWRRESVIARTACIARSLTRWTGRTLITGPPSGRRPPAIGKVETASVVFRAPFVLVSHGAEPDPVLNYGNQAALDLWEMTWEELTRTPSRLTAEAPNREERARLLDSVSRRGFIDDYSGVRISRTGRRFRIFRATVWNVLGEDGAYAGQAAMFDRWEFL